MTRKFIIDEDRLEEILKECWKGESWVLYQRTVVYSHPYTNERERVLDELKDWCNQRWFEVESDEGETFSVIHVGDILAEIEQLRQQHKEHI